MLLILRIEAMPNLRLNCFTGDGELNKIKIDRTAVAEKYCCNRQKSIAGMFN